MSPGLLRARRQFRTKNAIVGVATLSFVVGIFFYSMAAVKQDVFDDLDDEVKERAMLDAKRAALSVEDEKRAMAAAVSFATGPGTTPAIKGPKLSDRARNAATATPPAQELPPPQDAVQGRGVLGSLMALIWGAPPDDKSGSSGDKSKTQ